MKSITIKGSESVGKLRLKPYVMLEQFNVWNQPVHFSRKKSIQKLGLPQTHSCDWLEMNHLINSTRHSVHPVWQNLHIDFFQFFDDKEITMEVPVKL
jgi:large subunit ribosomal protein L25